MSLQPNTELVALAWLTATVGLPDGLDLPEDNTTWAASGFIQVHTVGGTPGVHFPLRQPVVSVDCWAVDSDGEYPPWNRALQMAEQVVAACYDPASKRQVTLPAAYLPAHVQSAYPLTEPRRVPSDVAAYAHAQFDLALNWVAAS
ncbi:MAG TPA: hypothetical protein VHA75_20680 [Rugosimonospora sp.]|nr:hypothetical protein [Rugosimonospora sp.]